MDEKLCWECNKIMIRRFSEGHPFYYCGSCRLAYPVTFVRSNPGGAAKERSSHERVCKPFLVDASSPIPTLSCDWNTCTFKTSGVEDLRDHIIGTHEGHLPDTYPCRWVLDDQDEAGKESTINQENIVEMKICPFEGGTRSILRDHVLKDHILALSPRQKMIT